MFLLSIQRLSFLILEINSFATVTIVVTHSEVVELWRIGVKCGEMSEAHERALCAQAFSRAWDLFSAVCRYSHFLGIFKWNFADFFPQLVLFLLPVVFDIRQEWLAGQCWQVWLLRLQCHWCCARRASVLSFLKCFALHSHYLYTFEFLCILIACSKFLTLLYALYSHLFFLLLQLHYLLLLNHQQPCLRWFWLYSAGNSPVFCRVCHPGFVPALWILL